MLYISLGLVFGVFQIISGELWNKIDLFKDLPLPEGNFLDNIIESDFIENDEIYDNLIQSDPNSDTTFHLFTRSNPLLAEELEIGNVEALDASHFNESWPTRIIIHGYQNYKDSPINAAIKTAYLIKGDFNVIVVDWGSITNRLNYIIVAVAVPRIGRIVGEFTKFLNRERNASYDSMYLIGHSLGAHVAGFAGKTIAPEKYNTIFALDAARPLFENRSPNRRLSVDDAVYVESIHTSTFDVGFRSPLGHASFYPNYSRMQSGCLTVFCNHFRSYEFFAESITSPKGFFAKMCTDYTEILNRNCTGVVKSNDGIDEVITQKMGGEPSTPKTGVFYLKTNSRPPFALDIF